MSTETMLGLPISGGTIRQWMNRRGGTMIPLQEWEEWIDGKCYSTRTSVLIARGEDTPKSEHGDNDWNIFLYRTPENSYFKVHLVPSGSKHHVLEPVTTVEALNLYGTLADRCVDLEDAFPDRSTSRS
jgi:hypothetical protein